MSGHRNHRRVQGCSRVGLGGLALWLGLIHVTAQSQPPALPQLNWHLTARPWQPLNSSRTNLLDKVEDIVNALAPLQYWNNSQPGDVQSGGDVQNGSIIDPYRLREHQYATPYYSFAVATAVANGRSTNLLERGTRALDHATADIAGLDGGAQANDSHGEFFGPPMLKALRLYKQIQSQYPSILTPTRIARWESRLTTSRVSYMNNNVGQNWRTYGMKGEWLRVQDGLIPRTGGAGGQGVDYIESYWLNEQRARYVRDRDTFGANPYFLTYHDDDPGPKQNFSYMGGATGNLLDMIYNGYDGPSRAEIESITRFCAQSCLLFVGGNGEAPAGGRTGDHVWNDVVYGNTFELAAEMAWADGDARLAGQYRRAARLAFQSAWRYQQEQGWFSVTKNLLPAAHQNHYASWSALANYNGYTEIHSSEAFATELAPIPEAPAPSEIGGYAVTLDDQFDTTFANAGGMQVQMCTEGSMAANVTGNLRWHTLGLVRFSRPNWDSRLGPGDGWIQSDGAQAISFAPTFFESGAWQMMSQQPDRFIGVFTPAFTHPLLIRGTLNLTPKSGQTGPSFTLPLIITPDGVLVDTVRTAGANSFGVTWPVLEFDGKHVLNTNRTTHIAATAFPKMSTNRVILEAESATLSGGVTVATTQTNYSGSGYAAFPDSSGAIEWTGVAGGDGGAATVGFRYTLAQATAVSRPSTLLVNGQPRSVTFEHTGNNSTYGGSGLSFPMVWHQVHLPVTLDAGAANTIRLEAGTAGGLNIDALHVFPADGAQPEPDQQNFICLDPAPALDASTPVRRTAYGDQRPVRVTNGDSPIATFVYPRSAGDPTAEDVRSSFVRSGTNFTSVLGAVTGNLYLGRTAAGGEGVAVDVNADGTDEVSFSGTCAFVLQLTNHQPGALEVDRFITASFAGQQVKLAPYTPIDTTSPGPFWNNLPVAVSGQRFEVTVDYSPASATGDVPLGFAGQGVTHASNLVAAVRFGPDGKVTAVPGPGLVEPSYQAGVVHRIRASFNLVAGTYSLSVKPGVGAEEQLLANAPLPSGVNSASALDTFAYLGDSAAATNLNVALIPDATVAILSPKSSLVFLNNTNTTLQLAGVVSNAFGPAVTTWSGTSGPGTITFGNSNALNTTARFSGEGVYGLAFSADVAASQASLTVVVNASGSSMAGLRSWWRMDESSGSTAFDSSGNGLNATVANASFVSGYITNGLQCNGSTSRAIYNAVEPNQVTVASWVRCDGNGGGSFPRIVNGQSYRLIFRMSNSNPGYQSVGFATELASNYGDWHSGSSTISIGPWYHVAASYDRSSLTNTPVFYINGVKYPAQTIAMPAGNPTATNGTGYIANNSAGTRGWNGLLDDVRIYNRLLSDGEVFALAHGAFANQAPIVAAGANQTILWPALANLNGAVTDDGKPTPPATTVLSWSKVDGPGVVMFGSSNAVSTTVSFSAPGLYSLQLAAADGEVQTVSSLTVNVIAPPTIAFSVLDGMLYLSWPTNGGPWRLQSQTNTLSAGLGTNWVDMAGSQATNQMSFPVSPGDRAVFYRLVSE